jgi:type VI secretion system protein ImpH
MNTEIEAFWARLQADPRRHDFFATLRRVDALHADRPRLGQALKATQEALRLGQEPALHFPVSGLSGLEREQGHLPRLRVHLFGLLGPNGPMPLHLTETTRQRLRHRDDAALLRFLDLFHHRLLSLFFRAWAQHQPAVQHDRPREDRYATWLGACAGLAQALQDGQTAGPVPPQSGLIQAGLLGGRSRHAEGLAKLLTLHFGVPVRIEQHVAHWLEIDAEDRTALGRVGLRGHAPLGQASTVGHKRLDRQFKFRIVVGPLDRARYEAFVQGGVAWRALRQWVQHYAGLDLRWDVQLVLQAAQVPAPRLGPALRLGVTSWLGRRHGARDRDDLRLRPDTCFLLRYPDIALGRGPRLARSDEVTFGAGAPDAGPAPCTAATFPAESPACRSPSS